MTSRLTRSRLRSVLVVAVLVAPAGAGAMACEASGPPEGVGDRAARTAAELGNAELGHAELTGGPCRGVVIGTDDSPHRVMSGHRAGTTFCLGPGVHRVVRPLAPQEGDTIAGLPGAVLNGSKVLTGWRQGDQRWTTSGHLPDEASLHGECLPEQPDCTFTEDVFLDGQRLSRAASADQVAADTFFADYSTNTITLGTDPRELLVEQAVAPSLVRSSWSGVTVRNLVIEKAANEAQEAAVDGRTSSPRTGARWRVLHNLVRLNHGVGIGIGSQGVVRGNEVLAQGQLGVSVWERGAIVDRNLLAGNGVAGYDPDWEAGGLKAWVTEDVKLVDNRVHDNRGPGLWSDGGCHRTTYRRNVVTGNWGAGIQHEISYDALIVRNRVVGNGLRHKGWAWEAGIQIQSSGGLGLIAVKHNEVADNPHGVMVLQSGDRRTEWPAPHGPHVVRNVLVRGNTVTLQPGQWTGLVHDVGGHRVFGRGIRFRDNTYRLESSTQRPFAWRDALLEWDRWRTSARQDRDGELVVLP